MNLFLDELLTPTGQTGPLSATYTRAAGGVWHAVLGAVFCGAFGWWGLGPAFAVALVYWLLKETGAAGPAGSRCRSAPPSRRRCG